MTRTDLHRCYSPISFTVIRTLNALATTEPFAFTPEKVSTELSLGTLSGKTKERVGNDSNLLIVFYVQIMPDDFVMQLHRF